MELRELLFVALKHSFENNQGLSIFAEERAKFEGWLKVELCEILSKEVNVKPEKDRVDVSFDDWGIEVKTINTNYRYANVKRKTRPITKNVQGIVDDIDKLKRKGPKNKAVCFVVFPVVHDNRNWKMHLDKIITRLSRLEHVQFDFNNGIPGVLYLGLI